MDPVNLSGTQNAPSDCKTYAGIRSPAGCACCGLKEYPQNIPQAYCFTALCPGLSKCKSSQDHPQENFAIPQPFFSSFPFQQHVFHNSIMPPNFCCSQKLLSDHGTHPSQTQSRNEQKINQHQADHNLPSQKEKSDFSGTNRNTDEDSQKNNSETSFHYSNPTESQPNTVFQRCVCADSIPWACRPFIVPVFSYCFLWNSQTTAASILHKSYNSYLSETLCQKNSKKQSNQKFSSASDCQEQMHTLNQEPHKAASDKNLNSAETSQECLEVNRLSKTELKTEEQERRSTEQEERSMEQEERSTEQEERKMEHEERSTEQEERSTEQEERSTEQERRSTEPEERRSTEPEERRSTEPEERRSTEPEENEYTKNDSENNSEEEDDESETEDDSEIKDRTESEESLQVDENDSPARSSSENVSKDLEYEGSPDTESSTNVKGSENSLNDAVSENPENFWEEGAKDVNSPEVANEESEEKNSDFEDPDTPKTTLKEVVVKKCIKNFTVTDKINGAPSKEVQMSAAGDLGGESCDSRVIRNSLDEKNEEKPKESFHPGVPNEESEPKVPLKGDKRKVEENRSSGFKFKSGIAKLTNSNVKSPTSSILKITKNCKNYCNEKQNNAVRLKHCCFPTENASSRNASPSKIQKPKKCTVLQNPPPRPETQKTSLNTRQVLKKETVSRKSARPVNLSENSPKAVKTLIKK